jgi:2-methylcitrate dehydratase
MTRAEELAAFVARASYDMLSGKAREELKIRLIDSLGCAIGALAAEPVRIIRDQLHEFNGSGLCACIGGGRTAPDRAAFYNSALVRYLDFNDSYLAPRETCHPSDNLGAVLAAAEYSDARGREFLTALAVSYQVQCRLNDVAPVRDKGFDHTTQGAYAVAAGVARALRLDSVRTAHAIAISGTAFNALRVTRTGALSNWKGLAYPNTAFGATHATFLAARGITGPLEVFEGNKGFMEAIAGPFEIDWEREDLERVTQTIVKKFNAEIHSQSAIEGLLELQMRHGFAAADVEGVNIEIFDVAHRIIGGGEEGGKKIVETKEQADHSLPFLLAVALLDGQVMPEQYEPERIRCDDVQKLLQLIEVRPNQSYSARFPAEMACSVEAILKDGRTFKIEKTDYEGFVSRPLRWEGAAGKFRRLAGPYCETPVMDEIIGIIAEMENAHVRDLTRVLEKVRLA